MSNLFTGLITSKTRIKLLIRLFLNPDTRSYLRELSGEFNISSNAVREELNHLVESKLLKSYKKGRNIYYSANKDHPLFPELISMVQKVIGIDRVVEGIVSRMGKLEQAYLLDDYAEGKDSGIIDLLLVGEIDQFHLNDLREKTERYIGRRIRTIVLSVKEFKEFKLVLENRSKLLLWEHDHEIGHPS